MELSFEILKFLKSSYPDRLKEKYSLASLPDDDAELLDLIARRRGFVVRGGEYDYERTSKAVIQDFRKQSFGKIILEKYGCE